MKKREYSKGWWGLFCRVLFALELSLPLPHPSKVILKENQ